jgi:type 1 glutamine amidotransferase
VTQRSITGNGGHPALAHFIDESSYTPREIFRDIAMGDPPVAWSHCPDRGRVFCSALGHTAASHERPAQ